MTSIPMNGRLIVRLIAAIGVVLSLLYATAAPSDFTTRKASTTEVAP
jgi:hypothetical protein